jgi:hypothetical protein
MQGTSMNGFQQNFDERQRPGFNEAHALAWGGRFPRNEIISLLDVNRPLNLAESTSQDLTVGELLDLAGLDRIRDLKLGYGTSAGSLALREAIAEGCGVPPEQVITTQGWALSSRFRGLPVRRRGCPRDALLSAEP